jgi:hypothetical protein
MTDTNKLDRPTDAREGSGAVRTGSGGESLAPYPSLTQAARMLGVATSTLSRRADVVIEKRGDRDQVLRPAEVLRLQRIYRTRGMSLVIDDLIALASLQGEGGRVREECAAALNPSSSGLSDSATVDGSYPNSTSSPVLRGS